MRRCIIMLLLNYLNDLVQRWIAGLPLNPTERAAFRLAEGAVFTAVLSILSALVSLLTKNPHAPLGDVATTAESAGLTAIMYAVWHYISSRQDPALLTTVTQAATTAESEA